MNNSKILKIAHLSGGYGAGIVLRDFSTHFHAGEVHCIVGRNGVGKSTLLKLIAGELLQAKGEIIFLNNTLTIQSISDRARMGISYCPQDKVVFDNLTVVENLTLMRTNRDLAPFEIYLEAFPRLRERLEQKAGTLSGGEKKILALSRVLSENRPLILVDEPTEGVQFENVLQIANLIEHRRAAGAAIILVEQSLGIVEKVGDWITVLDHGEIVSQDRIADIDMAEIEARLKI